MPNPGHKYTDNDLRSIAASIDLTTELILRGKIPKEREQAQLLIQAFNSNTMFLKGYRVILDTFYAKPDSYFEPLLSLMQDAAEAIPAQKQPFPSSPSERRGREASREDIERGVREGSFQRVYSPRPEVESWIDSTVSETFGILEEHSFKSISSGKQLAQLTIGLRFAYAQLLSALNEYIVDHEEPVRGSVQSFAAVMIKELRSALLTDTVTRILEHAPFEGLMPDYFTTIQSSASPEKRLRTLSLSARSEFNALRAYLETFESDREQILEALADAGLWDRFLEEGLPNLQQFLSAQPRPPAAGAFFVPGQLSFVDYPPDPKDPPVLGTFDSHSNQQYVAIPSQADNPESFQLTGPALGSRLQFAARASSGLHIDENNKLFPAWVQRFIAEPNFEGIETVRQAVQDVLEIERRKIGALWISHPEVLGIISDDEPTVIIFEGPQVTVLGTCMPGSTVRSEFFSKAGACSVESITARTPLELDKPELWFARVVVTVPPAPPILPAPPVLTPEEQRQAERREFREAIQLTGQMNYREFVASLSAWGVIETNDGRGGHGSLFRIVDKSDLRAGTWGKLRDPERHMNFARMYEILDSLRISIADYSRALLREQL